MDSSELSSSEVINLLHDEHLSAWDNHVESLIKLKDDKLLVKTVIFLGTKVACDNHHESDEEEIRRLLTTRVSAWSLPKSKKVELSQDELGNVLLSINSFCEAVLDKLPYLGKDLLPNLICTGIGVLAASPQLSSQHPALLKEFLGLQQKNKEINETFETEKEVVRKGGFSEEYERILHSKEPPQDFRKIEIVPTLKELLEDKRPFLRPNKIKAYFLPRALFGCSIPSFEGRLRATSQKRSGAFSGEQGGIFEDEREEKQQDASVRIYTGVTFHHVEKSRESGKVHFFNLPQEMVRKVNWAKSKKLLPGCLVMLTSDCCETAIFATTLAPPFDQSKSTENKGETRAVEGILRVSIETGVEQVEKHLSYVMLECEAYFEAYRYNLGILQKTKMVKDDSLMNKFIVEASSSINIPLYAKRHGRRLGTAAVEQVRLTLPMNLPVYGPMEEEDNLVSGSRCVPISQTVEWPDSLIKTQMGLDDNQYQAYKSALTSELSIIQGPPGTGKTFIGLQIVKTLLLNKVRRRNTLTFRTNRETVVPNSPILVLCYTNHALDQFLELLLREISDLDLVRVGGQCKSDILKGHSLQEKRIQMDMSTAGEKSLYRQLRTLERAFSELRDEVRELENPRGIFAFKRSTLGQNLLLKLPPTLRKALESGDWLGVPEEIFEPVDIELKAMVLKSMALNNGQTRQGMGNEGMGVKRDVEQDYDEDYDMDELLEHRLEDAYYNNLMEMGGGMSKPYCYLTNCSSPYKHIESYGMSERWAFYFKVVEIALKLGKEQLEKMEETLDHLRLRLKEEREYLDGLLLKQTDVIGMTTTGAAKNHLLLEIAKPQIVVIEEAAEILEAHIVTSLTEDCNQLILIGDHLQLRPSTNVYQLEQKYHMNVSLFERMILNKINLCTLKTQHRMCPEVADLIVGPIYEQLHNHPKVLEYPHVKGVVKNLYFLTHSQLENTDTELLSKSNYFEANFISGLCEYLLNQGYSKDRITILTTYTGQMFLLKKNISASCTGVRITCVDNYQGEENDIILLSLVRSNEDDQIGFVGIDNRICVALSRAKHGMYIVGNLESLMKNKNKTWKKIGAKLEAGGNCGGSLELICAQHGNKTKVQSGLTLPHSSWVDVVSNATWFWSAPTVALDHDQYKCKQRCEKRCPFEHQCHARCGLECPPCRTAVLKELPCGHELPIACSQDPLIILTKELKCELKHKLDLACHVKVSSVKCEVLVEKTLTRCGHTRIVKCHEPGYRVKCDVEVEYTFPDCSHKGNILCCQKGIIACRDNCRKMLDCGHECPKTCHIYDDPTHKKYVCRQECKRVCVLGHPCKFKHRCYGRCPPCPALTPKKLECGHEAKLPCHKLPETHTALKRFPNY
ncbi:NFX1-type zinc finger-containing protein 1 [Orchesella cincta]|uniref:NFX1-type zinc finger-containing protein 1 n=1 Tax=Orchesella cincta TaxID=48709 RepID=A0A1D2M864_ORCCI|nr:NFX1-type zinc finger-containing protein 1 [Orchesella cincta]